MRNEYEVVFALTKLFLQVEKYSDANMQFLKKPVSYPQLYFINMLYQSTVSSELH